MPTAAGPVSCRPTPSTSSSEPTAAARSSRTFDGAAWGDDRLVPTQPVSASFTACDVNITSVRYICNPDIPAAEGTQNVGT